MCSVWDMLLYVCLLITGLWRICAINHSPSAHRCCTLASTEKLHGQTGNFYTQMQIFNFISIIKPVSTKQRQMGFTAAFSLLTHCRSKRYRTLLLHITYQEVLKKISQAIHGWMSEQWCTQSVGPSLMIKISHCYSETHHSNLIRTGWDIHGLVKRNVSCRPFAETQTNPFPGVYTKSAVWTADNT